MAGLYIHIPFCHSKCIYCDFYSTPDLRHLDQLLDALGREYSRRRDEISEKFNTVYFGGGTPSYLGPRRLQSSLRRNSHGCVPLCQSAMPKSSRSKPILRI